MKKKLNNKSCDYNTRFHNTYLLHKYDIGIDYYHIRNRSEDAHTKKSNNKSSECNTIFDDTYRLYKHNIGIDYHHIRNRNEHSHTKKGKLK